MSRQADNQVTAISSTESPFVNDNNINSLKSLDNEDIITREIEFCLVPCPNCTGIYIDSISGNRLRILCHHSCHNKLDRS